MPRSKKTPDAATTGITKFEIPNEAVSILAVVASDLEQSDVGQFHRMRACIGLAAIREMCPHGDWTAAVTDVMPQRHPRTIRRYIAEANTCLERKGMSAAQAWQQLRHYDADGIAALVSKNSLMLGAGEDTPDDSDIPAAVAGVAEYLNNKLGNRRSGAEAGAEPRQRKLTKTQRKDAAHAALAIAISKAQSAMINDDWLMLDTETLEAINSSYIVLVSQIKKELRRREV
jgi:hypothetical protein